MTQKAIVTQIDYAGITFEGLMLPDGSYRIAVSQAFNFLDSSVLTRNQLRTVKALLGKEISVFKVASEINSNKVNTLSLEDFNKLLMKLAFKGNEIAQNFLLASATEKLERVFDNAFGIVVEERERESRFAARLMTRATFRPLTDELQKQGFKHGWQYGKYIHTFQEILGFEDGTRDNLDLQTLLMLGNCQAELKILMQTGYEPWDALTLWKETRKQ